MFVNNRPDALGMIGRAIGQPVPQAVQPVQPAPAAQSVNRIRPALPIAVSGAVAVSFGATREQARAEAETAQLKTYLANITRADPGMVIALTEQAARDTSQATLDTVMAAYEAV